MSYFPLIVLSVVFVLIAVRHAGVNLKIWEIMGLGAVAVVASGSLGPLEALYSINIDVMLFLFGMFVVGEALVESAYLYHVSHTAFKAARSTDGLVILILFVMGFFSAFLMNDTVAVIGTPLVMFYASKHRISSKLLLLALCFSITIGSVASPIGNPQNLLIAIGGGIHNPFVTFFKYLFAPTVLNLLVAYIVLKVFYGREFHKNGLDRTRDEIKDHGLALLSKISLFIIFILVGFKILAVFLYPGLDFRLTYIALAAAAPILILSPKRAKILRQIDWHTLVFFAALFILMEGVWRSGVIQGVINGAGVDLTSTDLILVVSVLLSQVLSNVPFVALFLPILTHLNASTAQMIALAAGSTIAGNLLVLGAASNVIVIQNAEKRGATLTAIEFAKVGVPLTALNVLVYWAYLRALVFLGI